MNKPLQNTKDMLQLRLKTLRAFDLMAMARQINGGPVGFDMNRKFQHHPAGPKMGTIEWMVDAFPAGAIEKALPAFEQAAQAYREGNANRPPANLPPPPVPYSPINYGLPEPKPKEAKRERDNSGLSESRVRTIAREEAVNMANEVEANIEKQFDILDSRLNAIEATKVVQVQVTRGEVVTTTTLGPQHKQFELLLQLAACRKADGTALNIWMTGPAGSGKTRAAYTAAEALKIAFHFTGAVDNEYKLLGFTDAQGRVVRTAFREAYEHGGVFLLDEVDGCHASAVLALNAALANGQCDFPDGLIRRHPDCIIMATANTWGTGATHDYIGRTKLDSASLDRFVMLAWEYDEDLERATSGNIEWARTVQAMRSKCAAAGIRHIISPRATYDGATLLAAGLPIDAVKAMLVRRGLPESEWAKIKV